jgi:hypothetical protein
VAGGRLVGLYDFFAWGLTIIATLTCPWPLTTLLAALAYKVRRGDQPIPMGVGEFWLRSAFAALGLAVLSLVLGGLQWLLVGLVQFPRGPVSVVLVLVYLPAAVVYFFWIFAFDEMLEALGVFLIYMLIPGLPLALVFWLTGLGKRVQELMAPAAALPPLERFLT